MKEKIEYEIIRSLLQKWYEGLASAEEEAEIFRLLHRLNPLPAEFAADKAIFDELFSAEEDLLIIPADTDRKILSALEEEIAADRGRTVEKRVPFFRRYSRIAAAAVGLILLGGVITIMKFSESGYDEIPSLASQNDNRRPSKIIEDTLIRQQQPLLAHAPLTVSSIDSPEKRVVKTEKEKAKRSTSKKYNNNNKEFKSEANATEEKTLSVPKEKYNNSNSDFSEEERAMLNSKYRVVKDAREADAILDNIFSRLESAIDNESCKISKVAIEYDSKMLRLNEDECITPYNEKYHEYTPI